MKHLEPYVQQIKTLCIEFKDVSLFNARERDIEMPYSEDTCLNFFGFLPKDKWNYYEGCFSHISTSDDDHFIMELMSGAAFKIKAVNVMYYSNNANKK